MQLCFGMILPTDIDLVPGAACTSVLLLFPSSLSMSEAVVDIGVADFEPVKSDNSSCRKKKSSILIGKYVTNAGQIHTTAHSSTEEWGGVTPINQCAVVDRK